jgi:hypothetical protein
MGRDFIHKINLDRLSCYIPDVGYVEYYSQWDNSYLQYATKISLLILGKMYLKNKLHFI